MLLRSRVHVLAYIPAIAMLLLIMMPMGISALASTELALTNKRIIGRVRKQRLSIAFNEVDTVQVRRSLPGLIFNYGAIVISGNGIRIRFPGITKPGDMKAMIDRAVEEALFGDKAAPVKPVAEATPPPPKRIPPQKPKEEIKIQEVKEEKPPLPAIHKNPDAW